MSLYIRPNPKSMWFNIYTTGDLDKSKSVYYEARFKLKIQNGSDIIWFKDVTESHISVSWLMIS